MNKMCVDILFQIYSRNEHMFGIADWESLSSGSSGSPGSSGSSSSLLFVSPGGKEGPKKTIDIDIDT